MTSSDVHGSPSTSSGNVVSSENVQILSLSKKDVQFLRTSWARACSHGDVGAELVMRLMNDPKCRFRHLLEVQSGDDFGNKEFTLDDVLKHRRAKTVGDGVVKFFNKVMTSLSEDLASEVVREMCMELGAQHYRWRVFFQAENWLSVKRCLLEAVVCTYKKKDGYFNCGPNFEDKDNFMVWHKIIQFVVRNMKKGFLEEALGQRSGTPTSSASSCSHHSGM